MSERAEVAKSLGEFGKKLATKLEEIAKDIGTLTVITTTGQIKKITKVSTGEDIYDITETGISAKTIIEMDGDIILKIPVKDADGEDQVIDERILSLHEGNVKLAMDNWKTFITTLVSVSKELMEFIT